MKNLKIIKQSNATFVRALSLCVLGFLFSSASSQAVTSKTFTGVVASSVQNGWDYVAEDPANEISASGGVIDTVTLANLPAFESLGTPGIIKFEFLAPTGMQFQLNGSKYSSGAALHLQTDLVGIGITPGFLGGSINLLNPTGTLTSSLNPTVFWPVGGGIRTRFMSDAFTILGDGTFTGIQFSFSVSGMIDAPVVWSGYAASGSTILNPVFTATADTSENNGPVLSLVPEPSAFTLLGVGLVGLFTTRRRKLF